MQGFATSERARERSSSSLFVCLVFFFFNFFYVVTWTIDNWYSTQLKHTAKIKTIETNGQDLARIKVQGLSFLFLFLGFFKFVNLNPK